MNKVSSVFGLALVAASLAIVPAHGDEPPAAADAGRICREQLGAGLSTRSVDFNIGPFSHQSIGATALGSGIGYQPMATQDKFNFGFGSVTYDNQLAGPGGVCIGYGDAVRRFNNDDTE